MEKGQLIPVISFIFFMSANSVTHPLNRSYNRQRTGKKVEIAVVVGWVRGKGRVRDTVRQKADMRSNARSALS